MNTMVSAATMAEIGALVGDPARANMLQALAGGRALPAGELAWTAGVTAQTASGHLARMTAAGLLAQERHGRHRYYRLASPRVAQMLEGIMAMAAEGPARHRPRSRIDAALVTARTCYDHLAGRLGVALADSLVEAGAIDWSEEAGVVTPSGQRFLAAFEIDLGPGSAGGRRCFCRPCLDWSERRPHVAGLLGRRLAERCVTLGWIARMRDTRAVAITRAGEAGFRDRFGIDAMALARPSAPSPREAPLTPPPRADKDRSRDSQSI